MEKSVRFFQRALGGSLTDEVSVQAKKRLSTHFKRNQEWEKAVPIWEEMVSSNTITKTQLFSFRELAMYFEHKLKNYKDARRITEEGLVLSMGVSNYYERDFSHRLDRLKRKIKKQENKP